MRPFRLVHIGLAAALAAASATAFGLSGHLSAAPGDASSVVPTVPCRLLDTRVTSTVGPRSTPIGPGEEVTFDVWGTNGNCTVPDTATGIVANVTTINGTADSFLTVFPADAATRPLSSNQNWLADNPREPHPNQVTVALSATGEIKLFNGYGRVDVIVDIMSYLTLAGGGVDSTAGNWGVINRNTVGSPVADLRAGPFSPQYTGDPEDPFVPGGAVSGPPIGTGSLNLTVADTELATFGNEVDYFNTAFDITEVGFHVYQAPENLSGIVPMPNIAFEIDPNVTGIDDSYATLVFFPTTQVLPGWGEYIDGTATGVWGITGAEFSAHPCWIDGPTLCDWATLQSTLINEGGEVPTLFTVAVKKGTDSSWHGAVDGLRINDTVYDFEEHGVNALPAT